MTRPHRADRGKTAHAVSQPAIILLVLSLLLVGVVRYRLIDFPLERDEGGFAYAGQLILDGVPPYAGVYDYKPPGLYLGYALSMLMFGADPAGIHTGLLLLNLGSMVLLFSLVRRWSTPWMAACAALVFGVLSLGPSVLGFAAHATQFVTFWMLAGYVLLESAMRNDRWHLFLLAGASVGVATLMKQPGIVFLPLFVLLCFRGRGGGRSALRDGIRKSGLIVSGFAVALLPVAIWLWASGVFGSFFYWNFSYGAMVGSNIVFADLPSLVWRSTLQAAGSLLPVWLLCVAASLFVVLHPLARTFRPGVPLFLFFSIVAVFIGYQFRSHYYIMALPAGCVSLALLLGAMRERMTSVPGRSLIAVIPLLAACYGLWTEREYFFTATPDTLSRRIYYPNHFADAPRIAEFIRSRTGENDRVAVLGSEPEILFLSGRRSATGYLYANFFSEKHGIGDSMMARMAAEIEEGEPEVIVMINQPFSWGAALRAEWPILKWARTYLEEDFELAGSVESVSLTQSRFRWDDEARADQRALARQVIIFQRRH